MENSILVTKDLNKIYDNKKVLDNVNLNVKRGDIYGLIGKNGAGKTTLIRIILSLIKESSGEVELFGEKVGKSVLENSSKIGAIVETPAFYSYFTAAENLEYYRRQKGIEDKECVSELLEIVGLKGAEKKKFKNFSLGMKQRLGLALSMLGNPEVLVLDEPINGLDPIGIKEFREILINLNKNFNTTILISSHILGELSQVASRYGFINNGQLIEEISNEELNNKCENYLRIKVNDSKKAIELLEEKFECKNYKLSKNNEIDIFDNIDRPEEINKVLVMNGIDIFSLQSLGNSLEEYYFNIIGGLENV